MSKIYNLKQFEQVGGQLGSNPGGTYKNIETGELFYLKFPSKKNLKYGQDIAKNEVLAAKLYKRAGVAVPEISFIFDEEEKLGIASKIEPTFKPAYDPNTKKLRADINWNTLPGLHEGLAVDAWLANWDVVGLEYDNIGTYKNNETGELEAFRIDTGGALLFRAQGEMKNPPFSERVLEINSLRGKDLSIYNKQAADIFKQVTAEKIKEGISKISNINDDIIKEVVNKYGPEERKQELANKLIARRENLKHLTLDEHDQNNFVNLWYANKLTELAEQIVLKPKNITLYPQGPLNKTPKTELFEEIIMDIINDKHTNSQTIEFNRSEHQIFLKYKGNSYNLTELLAQVNYNHLSFSEDIIIKYQDILLTKAFENIKSCRSNLPEDFPASGTKILQEYLQQPQFSNLDSFKKYMLDPAITTIELVSIIQNNGEKEFNDYEDTIVELYDLLQSPPQIKLSTIESLKSELLNFDDATIEILTKYANGIELSKEENIKFENLQLQLKKLKTFNYYFIDAHTIIPFGVLKANIMQHNLENTFTNLNYGEMAAISLYTSEHHRAMNRLLRGEVAYCRDYDDTLLSIAIVSSALNKIPTIDLPHVVRIQSDYNLKELIENTKSHNITQEKTFISTSTDTKAQFYAINQNVRIIYKNIKGVNISPLSQSPEEYEYLIPPSTQVKWTGYQQKDGIHIFTAEGANVLLEQAISPPRVSTKSFVERVSTNSVTSRKSLIKS